MRYVWEFTFVCLYLDLRYRTSRGMEYIRRVFRRAFLVALLKCIIIKTGAVEFRPNLHSAAGRKFREFHGRKGENKTQRRKKT